MKRTFALTGLIVVLGVFLSAGGIRRDESWAGVQLTAIHHTTYMGGNFELGIGGNMAIGGDVMTWLEGRGGMVLAPAIIYHFPHRISRIDLSAGAGPVLSFGFSGGSACRLRLQGGVRYWITSRLAGYVKLVAEIGDNGDLGGTIGVNWRL